VHTSRRSLAIRNVYFGTVICLDSNPHAEKGLAEQRGLTMASSDNQRDASTCRVRNRRHKYVINPAFQWKYALTITIAVFLISSIVSSVLYGLLHHQARLRFMNPETYTAEVTLVIFLFGAVFSALTAGAVGVWCVVVTHRVCGPLYVLDRYLAQLAQGRIPKLRPMRRKDEFKELYSTFSKAIESLTAGKQAEILELTEAIRTAESAMDADDNGRKRAFKSLKGQLETMRRRASDALGDGKDWDEVEPATKARPAVDEPVVVT